MAKVKGKIKKKVKETQMDVSFQDQTNPNVAQTTQTVDAATPADALKMALQGKQMKGPITINPNAKNLPSNPAPGGAFAPPSPGKPMNPNGIAMEGIQFPQRIMLPEAFAGLLDEIVETVEGAKMITVGGRRGVVLENRLDYKKALNVIYRSSHSSAAVVMEGLIKAKAR